MDVRLGSKCTSENETSKLVIARSLRMVLGNIFVAIVSFIKDLLKHVTKYEKLFTSSHRGLSVRKGVLKNFHKIHKKTPVPKSLF